MSDRLDKSDELDGSIVLLTYLTRPTCMVRCLFGEAQVSRDPLSYGR